jgi:TrpR-related protein YerC/YecD
MNDLKLLSKALAVCADKTEIEALLFELLSPKEVKEIGNRLQAAEMLLERKLYITIGNETGASSATIAKIAKLLKQRNSGLKNVFYRLYGRQKYADLENDRLRIHDPFSF